MRSVRRRVRLTLKFVSLALLGLAVSFNPCYGQDASTGKVQGTVTGKEGEKIAAAVEAAASWLAGATPAAIIDRYREHVADNRKRLSTD